ncbi:hypothetical protein [Alienimonas chondri]|uniref:Uncharacterized protein n=1 Tax=Alienimonas chondri TaxID=2681879 RepID=A0ABX1VAR2_9PLAN|nr:hypothetical protein [Alienimonas chondri]NNJ24458.1 hypothetical protein [Alienimonas chondri]
MNQKPAALPSAAEPAPVGSPAAGPPGFAGLVASRREWIETVLRPWCRAANRTDLRLAESAWADLAGDVGARETLWAWAWERFPVLCVPGLTPPAESRAVRVTLNDGAMIEGTPDGRRSVRGELWLVAAGSDGWTDHGPFDLDAIATVEAADDAGDRGPDPAPRSITMPH